MRLPQMVCCLTVAQMYELGVWSAKTQGVSYTVCNLTDRGSTQGALSTAQTEPWAVLGQNPSCRS